MPRLDIVGFGVGGAGNTTLSANSLIKSADRVFLDAPSPELGDYLQALGVESARTVDLLPLARDLGTPSEAYPAISRHVIDGMAGCERSVFVVEGNPQLYNIPVRMIVAEGRQHGWEVTVHPAVSSLDTLLIDLDLQIEETGLLLVDAGRVLARGVPLSPGVPTLLLQLAACTLNRFIDHRDQTEDVFVPLRTWLLQFYPESHPFLVMRSAVAGSPGTAMRIDSTVRDFVAHAPRIDYFCTGYLPAVGGSVPPATAS